jgi:hypothetical protein
LRKSLLATVAAVSLIGALAIIPASASAAGYTVLCKTSTPRYCPMANTYMGGTEFKTELAAATQVKLTDAFGLNISTCNKSQIDGTLTEKVYASENQKFSAKTLSFSECDNSIKVLNPRGGEFSWTEGSNGILAYIPEIEVFVPMIGQNCRFRLWGPPPVTGGNPATITYTKTATLEGEGGTGCSFSKAYFSATYKVTSPAPLYVQTW